MKYLRAKAVAERLNISVSTVWKWSARNIIPAPTKLTQRVTVWKASDIDAFVERMAGVEA